MTRPDVFEHLEIAHYTESKAFKAYCKDVLAFLQTCREPVSIRCIHDHLGRDRMHMTMDVLEWMQPTIASREYGAVTRYFIDRTLKPKKREEHTDVTWRTFKDIRQIEAQRIAKSKDIRPHRWGILAG